MITDQYIYMQKQQYIIMSFFFKHYFIFFLINIYSNVITLRDVLISQPGYLLLCEAKLFTQSKNVHMDRSNTATTGIIFFSRNT